MEPHSKTTGSIIYIPNHQKHTKTEEPYLKSPYCFKTPELVASFFRAAISISLRLGKDSKRTTFLGSRTLLAPLAGASALLLCELPTQHGVLHENSSNGIQRSVETNISHHFLVSKLKSFEKGKTVGKTNNLQV